MSKFIKIIYALCTLCFVSCWQKESKGKSESAEDYSIHTTRVEFYEIGYNSNNEVYLTDKRTNEQIVFVCEGPAYGPYSKENLLSCYKTNITVPYSEASDELCQIEMRIYKNASFGNDVVYSVHFKSNMTRYYVNYKDVYDLFHV